MYIIICRLHSEHESLFPDLRVDWIHFSNIESLLVLSNDSLASIFLQDTELSIRVTVRNRSLSFIAVLQPNVSFRLKS